MTVKPIRLPSEERYISPLSGSNQPYFREPPFLKPLLKENLNIVLTATSSSASGPVGSNAENVEGSSVRNASAATERRAKTTESVNPA